MLRHVSLAFISAAAILSFTIPHEAANAQTPCTSLSVSAPQLTGNTGQTGNSTTLQVTVGGLSGCAQQSTPSTLTSSDTSTISISPSGVLTFLKATFTGVTITATNGPLSASLVLYVLPQTRMYATDGAYLSLYDITLGMAPAEFATFTPTLRAYP